MTLLAGERVNGVWSIVHVRLGLGIVEFARRWMDGCFDCVSMLIL